MHVLWRRPDGFHGASPSDFKVFEVAGQSRIWLHKTDQDWFPFRVSGGWQDDDATNSLNQLVNLLDKPEADWLSNVTKTYHHSRFDDVKAFWEERMAWLKTLAENLKGDKWEIEIMTLVLTEISKSLDMIKPQFFKGADAGK